MKNIPFITAEQMRQVDGFAVENGLLVMQMMEHAALHMARHIQNRFPNVKKILILAGPGHNGGDGIAAARHLKNWGYEPMILLSHPPEKLKEVSRHHLDLIQKMNIRIHQASEPASADMFKECDLIVDALLGYALEGNPREPIATLINQANGSYKPVIAFDNPSGLDVTTGEQASPCIQAESTLTLALPKTGLKDTEVVGELFLADLGIPKFIYDRLDISIPSSIFFKNSIISL